MVNIDKLKGKMVEKRLTVETLSEKMGMHQTTLYRRINGNGLDFTIGEVNKIVASLDLTNEEATEIFFAPDVA